MARITAKRYIAYSPPLFPAQVIAPTSANAWTLCGNNVKIRRSRWPKGRPRRVAANLGVMNESQLDLQLYGLRDAARRSLHQLRRECRGADLGVRPRRYCRRAVFGRLPRGAPAVLLHAARALARAASVLGSRLAGPIFTFGSPMSWPLSVCTVVPTV